jgi:hypothetical protein
MNMKYGQRYKAEIYHIYDQMLDDCYSDIDVLGVTYTASELLKQVDPIRYEIGLDEYLDSLREDYLWCDECEEILSGFACEVCCGEEE